MRSVILLAILCIVVAGLTPVHAGSIDPAGPMVIYSPAPTVHDAIPAHVSSYRSRTEATLRLSGEIALPGIDGAPGAPVALRRPSSFAGRTRSFSDAGAGGTGHTYLPVLLSALVPGAGEMYLGHIKRGVALMAVEVGAWSGYFYKHDQGLDTRAEYEAFADTHWDQRRWLEHHFGLWFEGRDYSGVSTDLLMEEAETWGVAGSGSGVWPGYIPWVSREDDKQHYYENIGKYDWYVSGWEDYVPGTPRDDLAPGEVLSRLREDYRDLRQKSNNQLDTANRFIYLSIGARVFSLVQTTLMVRNSPNGETAGTDNGWILRARSRGFAAGEVALEYRFK